MQLDPCAGNGFGDGLHLDGRLGQRRRGVDIDPLTFEATMQRVAAYRHFEHPEGRSSALVAASQPG